jgi:hypothetical protein
MPAVKGRRKPVSKKRKSAAGKGRNRVASIVAKKKKRAIAAKRKRSTTSRPKRSRTTMSFAARRLINKVDPELRLRYPKPLNKPQLIEIARNNDIKYTKIKDGKTVELTAKELRARLTSAGYVAKQCNVAKDVLGIPKGAVSCARLGRRNLGTFDGPLTNIVMSEWNAKRAKLKPAFLQEHPNYQNAPMYTQQWVHDHPDYTNPVLAKLIVAQKKSSVALQQAVQAQNESNQTLAEVMVRRFPTPQKPRPPVPVKSETPRTIRPDSKPLPLTPDQRASLISSLKGSAQSEPGLTEEQLERMKKLWLGPSSSKTLTYFNPKTE